MKSIFLNKNWHPSWKQAYIHDLNDIYNCQKNIIDFKKLNLKNRGYTYAYANRFQQTVNLIQKCVNPGGKILDLAAGGGNFSLVLAELGYEVTWNDLREELVDYVKLKYEKGKINYLPGNIFELDLEPNFDLILIAEVIEHVAYPDKFLEQVSKYLKPGGHIIMTTPNGEYIRNQLPKFSDFPEPSKFESEQFKPDGDGHIFLLHIDEVEMLAKKSNLTVKEFYLINNFFTRGCLKTEQILSITPYFIVENIEKIINFLPLLIKKKLARGMCFILTNSASI
ncbi:3-demethylubiquinone-9 3-methyltransferase [Stanieria cyanosphaera PCC 7437]|uniref:3-demethylubiquinone-9 3-methyltransferase n=1 Tax=Stanieria cyanosphaera (strain ATCC 29371 / PCC 7437) TaxID=111780 RepID=K9XQN6_STAC7|nr:methyltransferase domain-containing protein [Stanieria cyanosphaera]AFZ34371.1 3-demethylubiquinone-9 3-methyltransferase [Stanieria cyanosphaera PCC 7437]